MEPLKLGIKELLEFQRNRPPYLMVDYAEVIPGESAKGYKDLPLNTWFFDCHFPGDPNMPGMLQVEALVQLCALTLFTLTGNKGEIAYLTTAKQLRWRRKVVPDDRFEMDTKLHNLKRGIAICSGIATVKGEIACEAEFSLALPHVLASYKVA